MTSSLHTTSTWPNYYSWVSHDKLNFTTGVGINLIQVNAQSLEGKSFTVCVDLVFGICLVSKMCNFVRFIHSSTV